MAPDGNLSLISCQYAISASFFAASGFIKYKFWLFEHWEINN